MRAARILCGGGIRCVHLVPKVIHALIVSSPWPDTFFAVIRLARNAKPIRAAPDRVTGRPENVPPHPERQHAARAQARYPPRSRILQQFAAPGGTKLRGAH